MRLGSLLRRAGHSVRLLDLLNHDLVPEVGAGLRQHPKRLASGRGKFYRQEVPKPTPYARVPRRYGRYGLPPEYAARLAADMPRPDLVLVTSFMTYWYPGVMETIAWLRKRWPGAPVILGGIYATVCHDHARLNSGADHVVRGPVIGHAEILRGVPLLEDCLPASLTADLWPLPALDLYGTLEGIPLLTSGGCPYRCAYCASRTLSGPFTARDPLDAAAEVRHWHETLGSRHFAFFDDALLHDAARRFIPFADAVAAGQPPLEFHAPNGLAVDDVTPEVAKAMRRLGVATLRLSLETAAEDRGAAYGFKASRRTFLEAVGNLEKAGYRRGDIGVYLLGGLPGQRWREMAESIKWVKAAGAQPYFSVYSPIPGTQLWPDSVRSSVFPLEEEPLYHNTSIFPCAWEGFNLNHIPALKELIKQ